MGMRSWSQFSIRGVLLLILLCALASWWWAEREKSLAVSRAIKTLTDSAAAGDKFHVALTWTDEGTRLDEATVTACIPPFAIHGMLNLEEVEAGGITDKQLAPVQYLVDLRKLKIASRSVTDRGMQSLASLGQLRQLTINCPITDDGLAPLAECGRLERLSIGMRSKSIRAASIQGQGLARLANLPHLRSLSLQSPALTDDGLKSLARLTRLESLTIRNPGWYDNLINDNVGRATMNSLRHCQGLTSLALCGMGITDADLVYLHGLRNLKSLDLSASRLTTQALIDICQLSQLESLYLEDTRLDDSAIEYLVKMPNLKRLDIRNAGISVDACLSLAALPKLEWLGISIWPTAEGECSLAALEQSLPQHVEIEQILDDAWMRTLNTWRRTPAIDAGYY